MAENEFKLNKGRVLIGVSEGGKAVELKTYLRGLIGSLYGLGNHLHHPSPMEVLTNLTYSHEFAELTLKNIEALQTGILEQAWLNGDIATVNRILGRSSNAESPHVQNQIRGKLPSADPKPWIAELGATGL